ncbi:beta-1,6-galactofuranosyltransferase [Leuconostoc citreum]|uniref:beta-1,6-galactofuranosyltransferase n=1 Tax=Leuconostoc citreum TaxID=33964 RepID=UPI00200AE1F7|nr:beta-1,6-galactofuranosyltransferase [Leuconostoc citreum]MCK8606209.1 beta-1,6-galactofuranosyltransferase [Leuconostoc citreum]
MTNWITRLNATEHSQKYDAIQIVSENVANSAKELGFQELNLTGYANLNNNVSRRNNMREAVLSVIQPGDLVVVQFPMWMHLNFQAEFFDSIKNIESVRMISLIQDIPTWMFTKGNDYDRDNDFWLNQLKKFDLIVVANEKMANKLREDGVIVPMVTMGIWDYIYQGPRKDKLFKKKLYYVGGRDIVDIDYTCSTPLHFYNKNTEKKVLDCGSVTWNGRKPSDEIVAEIDGGFGIVVSDNIKEKSNMNFVYYNQFNNPTKLSLYLAAGIPLIVSSKTPHAAFVKEHGIGLVVDDLNDIDQMLATMIALDYQKLINRVIPWQKAVCEGYFVKRALMAMIRYVDLGIEDDLVG